MAFTKAIMWLPDGSTQKLKLSGASGSHPESTGTVLWMLPACPHLVHAVEEFPVIRGHLVGQVLRAHQLKSSHCPSGGAFLFWQGSLGIIVKNWIRITKGLSAEYQTLSGVFEGKGFGEHGQAYFEMLVLRLKNAFAVCCTCFKAIFVITVTTTTIINCKPWQMRFGKG